MSETALLMLIFFFLVGSMIWTIAGRAAHERLYIKVMKELKYKPLYKRVVAEFIMAGPLGVTLMFFSWVVSFISKGVMWCLSKITGKSF